MSQGFSSDIPSQPPASTPPAKRGGIPTWLIIVGVVVVLCAVAGAILLCVLPAAGLTLLGPAVENVFTEIIASLGCQVENPGLDEDVCATWAGNLSDDYPDAVAACQSVISNDNSAESASKYYQCLIDEGVDPPQ